MIPAKQADLAKYSTSQSLSAKINIYFPLSISKASKYTNICIQGDF